MKCDTLLEMCYLRSNCWGQIASQLKYSQNYIYHSQ
jgi:hypothetical protein